MDVFFKPTTKLTPIKINKTIITPEKGVIKFKELRPSGKLVDMFFNNGNGDQLITISSGNFQYLLKYGNFENQVFSKQVVPVFEDNLNIVIVDTEEYQELIRNTSLKEINEDLQEGYTYDLFLLDSSLFNRIKGLYIGEIFISYHFSNDININKLHCFLDEKNDYLLTKDFYTVGIFSKENEHFNKKEHILKMAIKDKNLSRQFWSEKCYHLENPNNLNNEQLQKLFEEQLKIISKEI